VQCAINLPNFGDYGDPEVLAGLAAEAEVAGWDGFFIWDHMQYFVPGQVVPVADPIVSLAAISQATQHIRFGPMVTPLARRRPWKVARETVSLDRLSGGRLILGVGLGAPAQTEFAAFGEETDAATRAGMLDEALEVVTGLWSGATFTHHGPHYQIHEAIFNPMPVQAPRIPVWVAGVWPNEAPLRRAAQWDGVFPVPQSDDDSGTLTPDEIRQVVAYVGEHRTGTGVFDVTVAGESPGDDLDRAAELVDAYAQAGVTWWQEALHSRRGSLEEMQERIQQGPPRR
jgi:alkanesulfonate monooxygenase SsuD/methylene tetrahydromethanopterin reductase-like flavin-dependent oxidoreductase (luciferase family)